MLERIRDIRASEARMYLRVREIFALAGDYDRAAKETRTFFETIQNKLHFASTGMTAAELIQARANHSLPNMGLTAHTGQQVTKADVKTAKNYLHENEIAELNRIVTMWLDYAEDQAKRRKQVFMSEWESKLDRFLEFNERDLLAGTGKVSHKTAVSYAESEYEIFAANRRAILEAEGERASIGALEETAKQLKAAKNED